MDLAADFLAFRALRFLTHFPFFLTNPLLHFTTLGFGFDLTAGVAAGGTLPVPENVALDGAPKIAGCEGGAARHASAVAHAGEETATAEHGTAAEQTCASYTSNAVSRSPGASRTLVRKNTSSPFSLASMNTDSSPEDPPEINATQPRDTEPNVALELAQPPTPAGSYS
jgi:hypothetical protein